MPEMAARKEIGSDWIGGVGPTWQDRGWGPGARDTFLGFNHMGAAALAGWRGAACVVQARSSAAGVSAPAQALTLTFSGTSSFSASGSSFSVTCGWCSGSGCSAWVCMRMAGGAAACMGWCMASQPSVGQ